MIEVESINSKLDVINEASTKLRYQDDDDIPLCPEFRPTEEEFSDFSGYLEKCVDSIGTIGIFKVSKSRQKIKIHIFSGQLIQFFNKRLFCTGNTTSQLYS